MVEAVIAAAFAFIILALVIHSGLDAIAKEVAGTRYELERTKIDFETLRVSFTRIEAEVSREIQTQQDLRDERVRAERRRLQEELARGLASGEVRVIVD